MRGRKKRSKLSIGILLILAGIFTFTTSLIVGLVILILGIFILVYIWKSNRLDTTFDIDKSLELINNCYGNSFGFDLEKIHKDESTPSEFHTNKWGDPLTIKDLDLRNREINFKDTLSSSFELVNYKGKNFLLGDNSCYPCSRVYTNGDRTWTDALIVPDGKRVMISPGINSPVRYNFTGVEICRHISSMEILKNFLDSYKNTFQNNDWFSNRNLISLITISNLSSATIFKALKKRNFLNPLQLSILSIYKDFNITNEELYKAILIKEDIPPEISYLASPSVKIRPAESTTNLISSNEFKEVIYSFSQAEINNFFEVEYLRNTISFSNLDKNFISDILNVNVEAAGWSKKINRLSKINVTDKFVVTFYKKLRNNLRNLENRLRSEQDYNIVGGLYSESRLYKLLCENFPKLTFISQHSPDWLGRQRFDIFIKGHNVAIEYNGRQHYEPVSFFGGKEGFIETKERDDRKRNKCRQNDCTLIEVKYDEDFDNVVNKVQVMICEA